MQVQDVAESNLEVALRLAEAGLPVFPAKADKAPLIKWRDDATTDPEKVRRWWQNWPAALVGLPTGAASGIYVVDLDVDRETGECTGEETLAGLGLADLLESAPAVRTPSGGLHLLFRHPGAGFRNTAKRIGPGVDTRGDGGYVIAAGSETPGGRYEARRPFHWRDLPDVPEALKARLRPAGADRESFTPPPIAIEADEDRLRAYVDKAVREEVAEVAGRARGDAE